MKKVEHYDTLGRHLRTEWVEDDISPTTGEVFSPIGQSVAAVIAYLESAPDDEKRRVGEIELANGGRKTVLKAALGKDFLDVGSHQESDVDGN